MKFSIIVCAFNEEKLLHQCLESLTEQDFPQDDFEVILIDDESTDRTGVIARDFIEKLPAESPHFAYYRIEHGGLSVARNTGIRKARGDVICFIDGDALARENWLTEYANTFNDQNCDYSSGRIDLLNAESDFARFLQNTRFKQSFKKPYNNHFHGVNMAFRRKVFDKLGGFHENFESRGDDTSFRNIAGKYYKYCPSPNAAVKHERPASFAEWFRVYTKELGFQFLVQKAVGSDGQALQNQLPLLKSLIILFLLLAGLAYHWIFIGLSFLGFLLSKRKFIFTKYNHISEWLFNFFFHLLDTLIKPFYFLKSYLRYRRESLIDPHTFRPKFLDERTTTN